MGRRSDAASVGDSIFERCVVNSNSVPYVILCWRGRVGGITLIWYCWHKYMCLPFDLLRCFFAKFGVVIDGLQRNPKLTIWCIIVKTSPNLIKIIGVFLAEMINGWVIEWKMIIEKVKLLAGTSTYNFGEVIPPTPSLVISPPAQLDWNC